MQWWLWLGRETKSDWLWLDSLFGGHDVDVVALIMIPAAQTKPSYHCFHPRKILTWVNLDEQHWPRKLNGKVVRFLHISSIRFQNDLKVSNTQLHSFWLCKILFFYIQLVHTIYFWVADLQFSIQKHILYILVTSKSQAHKNATWLWLNLVAGPQSDVSNPLHQFETQTSRERRVEGRVLFSSLPCR